MRAEPNRIAGILGVLAALLHLGAFVLLGQIDAAYRPGTLERWYYAVFQHETATEYGAWCLTFGAILLLPWVAGIARTVGPYCWPGAALVAGGAIVHAAGSLFPFVVVRHLPHGEEALGQTLLAMALSSSAVFSFAIGAGVVLISLGMARAIQFPMWLSGFGLIAGLLMMGAVGQASTPIAADFVFIAAPVFGAWLLMASVTMAWLRPLRPRDEGARSDQIFEPVATPNAPTLAMLPLLPVPEADERAATAK